jgi:hypothetical protein
MKAWVYGTEKLRSCSTDTFIIRTYQYRSEQNTNFQFLRTSSFMHSLLFVLLLLSSPFYNMNWYFKLSLVSSNTPLDRAGVRR